MEDDLRGSPHIVGTQGHSFSDVPEKCLSIINLASVRDLERVTGKKIDPIRFRGNLYIDGLAPWQEFDLVGTEIKIGDVALFGLDRIMRCAATSVNPDTGQQDMALPQTLKQAFGHMDCGIYMEVSEGGNIKVGDRIKIT